MKKFYKIISDKIAKALVDNGYEDKNIFIMASKPEFGDYQYNNVMSLAKNYHENPIDIAKKVVKSLEKDSFFASVSVAGPGFINMKISNEALIAFFNENDYTYPEKNQLIFLDYGGANVAKSLHVGHLRSANIGEALKRLCQFLGYQTISDTHLGDWGRPLGLVILELSKRYPDLPFFDGLEHKEYPNLNIDNKMLEEIYPYASLKAKEDEEYLKEAKFMTKRLQDKEPGIFALWQQIMQISKKDIRLIYDRLNTSFDLYKGEMDAGEVVPSLLEYLDKQKVVTDSEGAKVIDVSEDNDKLEIPPLLLIKSDGGILYSTTELATIFDRVRTYHPNEIWYMTDKRQSLYFTQVFRAAKKTHIIDGQTKLVFVGFGTMNGKDGKPFKTRDGGVMRLNDLLDLVHQECLKRLNANIRENREEIAEQIALATIKYADMLPVKETDYCFDLEKFCSLEGKTGPFILYSTIRMKSLLQKAKENNFSYDNLKVIVNEYDRDLIMTLNDLDIVLEKAFNEKSLNEITEYLYRIATSFNRFYTENIILKEKQEDIRSSWLYLTSIAYKINMILLDILAIKVPSVM